MNVQQRQLEHVNNHTCTVEGVEVVQDAFWTGAEMAGKTAEC